MSTQELTKATSAIVRLREQGAFEECALVLDDPDLPFSVFEELGAQLGFLGRSVRWWTGDWINFGEGLYGDRVYQAADITRLNEQTLMKYARICEHVPRSRRRHDLSFSAHAAVIGLTPNEQRHWLAVGAKEKLSEATLRQKIREAQASQEDADRPADERLGSDVRAGRQTVGDGETSANGRMDASSPSLNISALATAARRVIEQAQGPTPKTRTYVVPSEAIDALRLAMEENHDD